MTDVPSELLWRVAGNNYNNATVRYRAVYPAYLLRLHHDVPSRFVTRDSALSGFKRLAKTHPRAIVFGRDLDMNDQAWLRASVDFGIPVIYDACDNIFEMKTRASALTAEILAANQDSLRQLVFTTSTLRDVFIRNGIPEDKCSVIPDGLVSAESEIAAITLMGPHVTKYRSWPMLPAKTGWRRPLPEFSSIPQRLIGVTRLVWFGLLASPYGQAGRELLPRVLPALNRLAQERDLDMLVVTNKPEICSQVMARAEFPWHFVDWSMVSQLQALATSNICVLPVGDDAFCSTKSANRALLALASGLPVVSNPHPSYVGIEDALHLARSPDNWYACLREALAAVDGEKLPRTLTWQIKRNFGGYAVARRWASVLGISPPAGSSSCEKLNDSLAD